MPDVSYWMPPHQEFRKATGCRPTGRVVTFFQLPRREWLCPDQYPGLSRGPYNEYAWWKGMGAIPMHLPTPEKAAELTAELREQSPEYRAFEAGVTQYRQRQQQRILDLSPEQQVQVRQVLDTGQVRNLDDAIAVVTGQAPLYVQDITSERRGRLLKWGLVGASALVLGTATIYYITR